MLLRHVHINAGNVDTARDWYLRNLGLSLVHEVPGKLAILSGKGDCQLGLEAGEPVSEPERVHLIFRVDDVDSVYAELARGGEVQVVRPPESEPYGHRVAIVRDPVGHTIELYTPFGEARDYD